MIIMVAVTVTIIAGENGVLEQTKESAELTEQAQLHEQIMGAMKLTNKGKIIVGDSYEAAKALLESQGYDVGDFNEADGTFEVTGKKGTYKYKITETEITIEETKGEETKPIIPTDQKYLLFTHDEANLTSTVTGFNPDYKRDDETYGEENYTITDLVIPEKVINDSGNESTVTQIGATAFTNVSTIKSVVFPETLEVIGAYSFEGCTGLTEINIPSKVYRIFMGAFSNCTSLTTVTMEEGVGNLINSIFSGCTSLTEAHIPSTVTLSGGDQFVGCSSDLIIYVNKYESECYSWHSSWSGDAKVIYKTKEGSEIQPIQLELKHFNTESAGQEGKVIITGFNQKYKLSNGVYGEGDYVIKDLIIPSKGIIDGKEQTVVGFKQNSFYDCLAIETVVIPNTVTEIPSQLFCGCTRLTKVTLPEGITSISHFAFSRCNKLAEINIPSSVTTIGNMMFDGCPNYLKIYVNKYESECSSWYSGWSGKATVIYKK